MEVLYDLVMILWRIVLAITILPFGLEQWQYLFERK